MENFNETMDQFLNLLKSHKGRAPIFSIDYSREEILIKDSCSAFIKDLVNHPGSLLTLDEKGLNFNIIKQ